MRIAVVVIVGFVLTISCNRQRNMNHTKAAKSEIQVSALLQKMTLREKASQMLLIGLPSLLKGDYWDERDSVLFDDKKLEKFIITYGVGAIHNTPGYLPSSKEWNKIISHIQEIATTKSPHKIPILYGIDNIHGANYVAESVMFPHQIGLAATWNPELVNKSAEITSYESRAASIPWNYNPNADVAPNPLWGRIAESFGEDPYLVGELTKAYIEGSQQDSLSNSSATAVCVKHFLGYGAGTNGKDRANALLPENRLRTYYLPPFEKAIASGAQSIMVSSNAVNDIPCHINSYYINTILKGELNFKGVVVSDFSDIDFLVGAHQVASSVKEATILAINAGLDMLMHPYDTDVVDYIVEAVEEGKISEDRINDAVTRILTLKFELGLFEKPYNSTLEFPKLGSEEHIEQNYKIASESITLLKNQENRLPLSTNARVLVTGYAANSMNVLNGAWSRTFLGRDIQYNNPSKKTIVEAVKDLVGKTNVTYVEGTDYSTDINTSLAVKKAKNVDYIIVCVGEIPATEKPSDINELELPEVQQQLIQELAKTDKPMIVVLVEGRPRIIRKIEPFADAILMGYLPGQEGGRAIADVLFGVVNPSGKLPYTYPKYSGNMLPYYHKKTDIRDKNWGFEGFYPQYVFGFGLSYTNFEYTNLKLQSNTLKATDSLKISVEVTNTGKIAGKETVQLYCSDVVASISPDVKRLIGFKKIALEPGETKEVSFYITKEDLWIINQANKKIVEEGEFEIQIGGNSNEVIKQTFHYKN